MHARVNVCVCVCVDQYVRARGHAEDGAGRSNDNRYENGCDEEMSEATSDTLSVSILQMILYSLHPSICSFDLIISFDRILLRQVRM